MDFDSDRIYYSHQNLHGPSAGGGENAAADGTAAAAAPSVDEEDRAVDADALRRHYREFLSECLPLVYKPNLLLFVSEWRVYEVDVVSRVLLPAVFIHDEPLVPISTANTSPPPPHTRTQGTIARGRIGTSTAIDC